MLRLIRMVTAWCGQLAPARALQLGRRLGWFLGTVIRYRRREVLDTLRRCLPDKSRPELKAIADGMYRHLGVMVIEFCRFEYLKPDELHDYVEIVGAEKVQAILQQGQGIIFLTGHIGNFELLGVMGSILKVPLNIITKRIKPAALNTYWFQSRAKFGLNLLPPRGSYRACLAALQRRELLGFVLDQNMRRERGIFVDFFGRPACTSPGLALLSAHSRTPVVPVFIIRLADGRHRIEAGTPLAPPADREPATIHAATQQYTRIIEDAVRAYPDQWIWLHRRWRTQPLLPGAGKNP